MTRILFLKADVTTHSQAQLAAGCYPKRKVKWRGLTISIETEAGELRSGTGPDGKPWAVRMVHPYGYILGTKGTDGEQVDCFLGPELDHPYVYVVHARRAGTFVLYDEDKVMIGFVGKRDALVAFQQAYTDERFIGEVTTLRWEDFKAKALETVEKRRHADRKITA